MNRKPTKPREPKPPEKTIEQWVEIWESSTGGEALLADIIEAVPEGVSPKDIRVHSYNDGVWDDPYGETYVYIEQRKVVPNPRYEYLKRKYDEAVASYPERLAEYERKCAEWEIIKEQRRNNSLVEKAEREAMWERIRPDKIISHLSGS